MSLIEQIRETVQPEFCQFEESFKTALQTDNFVLNSIFEHLYTIKGKQLRPTVTLLAAKLCRGITDKTIQTAVSLELIHTASLVHDDVVDMSDKRRGQASINEKWNNKIAVLAGDYLLAKALQTIAALRNANVMNIVLDMAKTLVSGELQELHYHDSMWISEEQYYRIIEQKTAMLFGACTEAGAVSAAATARQQHALREYGKNLGMCFQLKDDELDYSDIEDIGKPRMSDIRDEKATLPLIISLCRAPKAEAEHIKELCQKTINEDDEQEIRSFVLRYDGMRYARRKMEEYRQHARDMLEPFHPSMAKEALLELLNYSINRLY